MNTFDVHILNTMENNQDYFNILRKIKNKPNFTQRKLANELGFSLGKLNYCLNALKFKGLVKIKNFRNNKNKINYIYVLTPKGIAKKAKLTINFMKRRMQEYEELKKELVMIKFKKSEILIVDMFQYKILKIFNKQLKIKNDTYVFVYVFCVIH